MRRFFWLGSVALAMGCGGNTGARGYEAAPAAAGAGGSAASSGSGGGGAGESSALAVAGRSEPSLPGGASGNEAGAAGKSAIDDGPRPYRALQITTGRYHACALLEDHRVKCWGDNSYGELGLGTTERRGLDSTKMGDALPFVDLGSGRSAKAVAAGRYTTCALLDDDSVKCWGMNLFDPRADSRGWDPLESTCRHASLSIL